jgi:hypothetical protein
MARAQQETLWNIMRIKELILLLNNYVRASNM